MLSVLLFIRMETPKAGIVSWIFGSAGSTLCSIKINPSINRTENPILPEAIPPVCPHRKPIRVLGCCNGYRN